MLEAFEVLRAHFSALLPGFLQPFAGFILTSILGVAAICSLVNPALDLVIKLRALRGGQSSPRANDRVSPSDAGSTYKRLSLVAASLLAVFLIALASIWISLRLVEPPALDVDGCRVDANAPASVAFVVDAAQSLSSVDERRVRAEIGRALSELPPYGWVGVFSISPADPLDPRLSYQRCPPRRTANPISESASRVAEAYEAQVRTPIERTIHIALDWGEGRESPIAETVAAVARVPRLASASQRTIIVISDGVQNFQSTQLYFGFDPDRSEILQRRLSELNGAKIVLVQLRRRSDEVVDTRVQAFWTEFAERNGATLELR
jgi:hypothetical protein